MTFDDALRLAQQGANDSGEPWYVYELARRRWRRQWTFGTDVPLGVFDYAECRPNATATTNPTAGTGRLRACQPSLRSMFTDIHIVCKWAPYIGLASMVGAFVAWWISWLPLTVALIVLPGMTWGVIWTGANNYGRRINDWRYPKWLHSTKICFVFMNLVGIGLWGISLGREFLPFSIPFFWGLGLILIGSPPHPDKFEI